MKPNYAFAKRQKEMAKKQKKEEKLKRKLEKDAPAVTDGLAPGESAAPAAQEDKDAAQA